MLWQALGDVWLWAGVPEDERGHLFGRPKAEVQDRAQRARSAAPALTEALGTFTLMRTAAAVLDPPLVAVACDQVYRWAEQESLISLAAHFAEAAAMAAPEDPARANEAARLCRRAAMVRRAASWYERAFQIAVRVRNRKESVWALLGYGSLLYGMGEYVRARPYFEKVARRAVNTGRRRTAAEAHHDLMGLCLDLEDYEQAVHHALLAEHLYPRYARRIPYLVHDCAVLLLRGNYFTPASSMLPSLPSFFPRPEEATFVWSTVARVAAGAGWHDRYLEAAQRTLQLVCLYEEHGAAAMVNLAEGAFNLGDISHATSYTDLALEIAQRRRDRGQAELARYLQRRIENREPAPLEAPAPEEVTALARRLAARLRSWAHRRSRGAPASPGRERSPPG